MNEAGMEPSIEAVTEPEIEHAASSAVWLRHTLEEILSQVRVLLDVDGCAFQTVDFEQRQITAAAAWFETPAIRAALQPVLQRPYDPDRGGVTEAAIERGEPLLICDMQAWEGAAALRQRLQEQLDPEAAERTWSWYRTSTFISCPVQTTLGRTLGVLALSAAPPRAPLGAEQLRVTEVFAGLAALALERTELLEREARRAETEELLHAAAQEMTASLDVDAVYRAIVDQAARLANAPTALLLSLDGVTQTLRCVASVGASQRLAAHRFALGEGALGAVASGSAPYPSLVEDRDQLPAWAADEEIGSLAHVPLSLGPRRFGVLTVCHPVAGALDERRLTLLNSLARPAAAAIANALEFQHQRRIAGALTRGYIPGAPPELEGFSLGVVYEPVGHEVSGGDVFGVWRLPGGALAVLVGDVSGKGLEVAAVSAMVRFFIEARSWDADCPAQVLAQANAILRRRLPGQVALVTAFLGIIDSGVLRYANAGHVPPLVVGAEADDAQPSVELRTTGVPLGIVDDLEYAVRELPFGPGTLMFASTDGLLEARRAGENFGQERIAALVEANAKLGVQELVELLHGEAESYADAMTDDVAIIALRAT